MRPGWWRRWQQAVWPRQPSDGIGPKLKRTKKPIQRVREDEREGEGAQHAGGRVCSRRNRLVIREGAHGARSTKQAIAIGLSKARSAQRAESEIRQLNASLERRVAERTTELVRSNEQLKRAEEKVRKHGEQVQIHRDVLLELAHSDKSNFEKAIQKICSLSAATLEVARVSYWSLQENDSAILCAVLHLRNAGICDEQFKGTRLGFAHCPAYFEALTSKRPIVADRALTHPATSGLAESYLRPLGISSMLDAPVWVRGEVVGVLCHEHIGAPRDWSARKSLCFGARGDGFAGAGRIKSRALGTSLAGERGALQQGVSRQPGEHNDFAVER